MGARLRLSFRLSQTDTRKDEVPSGLVWRRLADEDRQAVHEGGQERTLRPEAQPRRTDSGREDTQASEPPGLETRKIQTQ